MEIALQKKLVVQLTGFKGSEKEELIELLFKLDCVFIDSEIFENCTHLIAKKPCRSEKWLAACASGKWVLTKDYIINSAESGRWLDETTYEWGYKIEKGFHYSPQMQSAPKRWRQHLTRTGALGAFSRWKVALLVKDGHKEREAFIRVLKAGQATLCNAQESNAGITHVFVTSARVLENRGNKLFKIPYYSVQYLGTYLLESTYPVEDTPSDLTDEKISGIMYSIWKQLCIAQARHYKSIKRDTVLSEKIMINNPEIGRVSFSRIEVLLEEHVFSEALLELDRLFPYVPPLKLLQSLLKHLLQGNVDSNCFGGVYDIFCNLLVFHPPWESARMLQYYLDLFQCPICKRGSWPFIEVLIRCFLDGELALCHQPLGLEMDSQKRREIAAILLKVLANIMWEEAKFLSTKLCEQRDIKPRAMLPSFNVGVFWPELRAMKLLTNQISTLTNQVLRFHKENHRGSVLHEEVGYQLNGMLGAAVEYWILLGFYMDKNLIYQVANDLVFYICVPCEDFSMKEKEIFIHSIPSPWLQMLVAEVFFKNLCMESKINIPSEPLSLEMLLFTYIPAIWRVGSCDNGNVQKFNGKRKMGHGHCLQSQRAALMLNGENQNQGEAPPDLPVCPKIRRKREAGSSCTKENLPSAVQVLPHNCQNSKGETALHTACKNNKVKKLIMLLSLPGTDINVKDNAGWTPLHEACNHGSTECVREILHRCPEVDLLSHVDGVTPLHDALLNGHVEIGKMLLQYAGPIILQHKDGDGKFPLDYVISPQLKKELFDIVQLEETIEDFHKHAEQEFDKLKIEFSAFLLSRMLLNFTSLFDLPLNSVTARTLYPNAASLVNCIKAKGTAQSFSASLVERYIEAIVTMQNVSDPLQAFPDGLLDTEGFNLQILMVLLQSMTSH
ncbi:SMC5-SMC6 complex localization factor 1 isoform X1 [Pelobates cultripes]|uniref:SMC5-SMC6 complex localization factor 1 isoform X1 n=1 Tax=Pelobates cultripes TaxID=61616 RepID=A0AAD1SED7_PELCU|nr:SMC5-SMC6 complex localization factor 1 isoform X1 [Pelobates cultripes]